MTWEELRGLLYMANNGNSIKARRKALRDALLGLNACRRGIAAAMKFNSLDEAFAGISLHFLHWYLEKVIAFRLLHGNFSQDTYARAMERVVVSSHIAYRTYRRNNKRERERARLLRIMFNAYGDRL
jgi:hypothetical protein